jgi:hypothetical protein
MQSSDAVGFLGKPVEDLYGRHVGAVVGFSLKTNGDVDSVGVDLGSGSFAEVKSNRLLLHEQSLIVVPMWKADVMRITGETGVLSKRISALHELSKDSQEGGASQAQYDQLRSQYEVRLTKVNESSDRLLQEMKGRMEEIARADDAMAKFLVNVNIQFRSGEISEASYGLIRDQCASMKARNSKEMEELMTAHAMVGQKENEEANSKEVQIPASVPVSS